MPIKRYRTFEEAQRAQVLPSGDPRIPDRLRQVFALFFADDQLLLFRAEAFVKRDELATILDRLKLL